jgi:hypothetical protein
MGAIGDGSAPRRLLFLYLKKVSGVVFLQRVTTLVHGAAVVAGSSSVVCLFGPAKCFAMITCGLSTEAR